MPVTPGTPLMLDQNGDTFKEGFEMASNESNST
jgi:hypothetical protein